MRLRMAERALRVARGTSAVQPGVGANALQTEFAQAAGVAHSHPLPRQGHAIR